MDRVKRERLKKAGWKVGSPAEFLKLTPEEQRVVEGYRKQMIARAQRRVLQSHRETFRKLAK